MYQWDNKEPIARGMRGPTSMRFSISTHQLPGSDAERAALNTKDGPLRAVLVTALTSS